MIKLDDIPLELYQKVADGNLLFWLSVSFNKKQILVCYYYPMVLHAQITTKESCWTLRSYILPQNHSWLFHAKEKCNMLNTIVKYYFPKVLSQSSMLW